MGSLVQAARIGAAALAVALAIPTQSVGAVSLPTAPGIRVIAADEVLSFRIEPMQPAGLAFRDASGALVRLVTSVDDPEILNRGDGAFHPADESAVMQALLEVAPECVRPLRADIYLLPYPRSGYLSSSADSRAIYLSPGVRAYGADQVAYLVTHELGHIFHRRFMPDSAVGLWAEWAALRGIADTSIYNEGAVHACRPHEIFAEDFRVLFGGPAARGSGSIENPRLAPPDAVPGLREFYGRLLATRSLPSVAVLGLSPNPVRAGQDVVLRLGPGVRVASDDLDARLIDVSGRVVADLTLRPEGVSTFSASIGDARGPAGRLASGAYWLRVATRQGEPLATLAIRVLR